MVLAAGAAIGVVLAVYTLQISPRPPSAAIRNTMIVSKIVYWTSWAALGLGVLWLGRRVPLTGPRRVRAVLIHAAASLIFAAAHMKTWWLVMALWRWRVDEPISVLGWLTEMEWLRRLFMYWQLEWEITIYWALLGLAHALTFREDSRERALTTARLDAELSQARLRMLQQQMQPHFLFNTLQSISVLMHRNVEAAEEMVARLGELLRASLRRDANLLVPLRQELEYAGHYLAIEQMNMQDRLKVDRDIPADTLGCAVPELLLQPLVENAVRHGLQPLKHGGSVLVRARRAGDRLTLTVSDDGAGLGHTSGGAGIALDNTRRRLELLYARQHTFEVRGGPHGRGVVVEITLPVTSGTPAWEDGDR